MPTRQRPLRLRGSSQRAVYGEELGQRVARGALTLYAGTPSACDHDSGCFLDWVEEYICGWDDLGPEYYSGKEDWSTVMSAIREELAWDLEGWIVWKEGSLPPHAWDWLRWLRGKGKAPQ